MTSCTFLLWWTVKCTIQASGGSLESLITAVMGPGDSHVGNLLRGRLRHSSSISPDDWNRWFMWEKLLARLTRLVCYLFLRNLKACPAVRHIYFWGRQEALACARMCIRNVIASWNFDLRTFWASFNKRYMGQISWLWIVGGFKEAKKQYQHHISTFSRATFQPLTLLPYVGIAVGRFVRSTEALSIQNFNICHWYWKTEAWRYLNCA